MKENELRERSKASIIVFAAVICATALSLLPLHIPYVQLVTEVLLMVDVSSSFLFLIVQLFIKERTTVFSGFLISFTLFNFAVLVFGCAAICEFTFGKGILYLLTLIISVYDKKIEIFGCNVVIVVSSGFVFFISNLIFTRAERVSNRAFDSLNGEIKEIDAQASKKITAKKAEELKDEVRAKVHYLFTVANTAQLMKKLNYVEYVVGILFMLFCSFILEFQNRIVMIATVILVYLLVSLINAFSIGFLLRKNTKSPKMRYNRKNE